MILVERVPNVIVDNETTRMARYRLFIGTDCAGRLPGLTVRSKKNVKSYNSEELTRRLAQQHAKKTRI